MITYEWEPQMHCLYRCDVCGKLIRRRKDVLLLRELSALPEDPATFQVHRQCSHAFTEQHTGHWREIPLVRAAARHRGES